VYRAHDLDKAFTGRAVPNLLAERIVAEHSIPVLELVAEPGACSVPSRRATSIIVRSRPVIWPSPAARQLGAQGACDRAFLTEGIRGDDLIAPQHRTCQRNDTGASARIFDDVPPGGRRPSSRARSITASAMRSFMLPSGCVPLT
jgi:hypothetical protein